MSLRSLRDPRVEWKRQREGSTGTGASQVGSPGEDHPPCEHLPAGSRALALSPEGQRGPAGPEQVGCGRWRRGALTHSLGHAGTTQMPNIWPKRNSAQLRLPLVPAPWPLGPGQAPHGGPICLVHSYLLALAHAVPPPGMPFPSSPLAHMPLLQALPAWPPCWAGPPTALEHVSPLQQRQHRIPSLILQANSTEHLLRAEQGARSGRALSSPHAPSTPRGRAHGLPPLPTRDWGPSRCEMHPWSPAQLGDLSRGWKAEPLRAPHPPSRAGSTSGGGIRGRRCSEKGEAAGPPLQPDAAADRPSPPIPASASGKGLLSSVTQGEPGGQPGSSVGEEEGSQGSLAQPGIPMFCQPQFALLEAGRATSQAQGLGGGLKK